MTTPSDDECIALALLHGAIIADTSPGCTYVDRYRWFVGTDYEYHNTPIKDINERTKGAAARGYCKRHKLIGDSHDHSTKLRSGHAA